MSTMIRTRRIRATLLAPIAAPAVVWVGLVAAGLVLRHPAAAADHTNAVAGLLFLAFVLVVFGFPAALMATIVILLPVSILIERDRVSAWPIFAAVGAVAGAVIMPAYLHWLVGRGSIAMWPGAGAVAGAAVGLLFWRLNRRTTRPDTPTATGAS